VNPAARYWDHGVASVPQMTGAAHVMDASDIPSLARDLGFELPMGEVLDVGCGSGRIARHCTKYVGADISQDAIAFCRGNGLDALLIDGPQSLPARSDFDMVTCLSVFTHIDEPERAAYLRKFRHLAEWLLVDVIPGDGTGGIPFWTASLGRFGLLLRAEGYEVMSETERKARAGDYVHHYYFARVA
jgi:SAM-dependent methyltransferase